MVFLKDDLLTTSLKTIWDIFKKLISLAWPRLGEPEFVVEAL